VNCALFQWCAFWKAGMFWKRSLVIIYGSCFRPVYYKYLIILYNGSSTPWLPLVAPGLHPLATPHLISFWMGSLENHANHFTNEHLPAAGSSTAPSNGYFLHFGNPTSLLLLEVTWDFLWGNPPPFPPGSLYKQPGFHHQITLSLALQGRWPAPSLTLSTSTWTSPATSLLLVKSACCFCCVFN